MTDDAKGFTDASWSSHVQGLIQFAQRSTIGSLGKEPVAERSQKLVRKIESFADSDILRVLEPIQALPPEQRATFTPQCTAGCCHCCYQWVRCTVPEALHAFDAVKASRSEEEIASLKTHLEQYAAELTANTGRAPQIACPLLAEGMCSIYENRPLVCRGTASLDVEKCAAGRLDPEHVQVPYVMPMMFLAGALKQGLQLGVREVGLADYEVVLGLALLVLLNVPDAPERYFAGEDVFAPARAPN